MFMRSTFLGLTVLLLATACGRGDRADSASTAATAAPPRALASPAAAPSRANVARRPHVLVTAGDVARLRARKAQLERLRSVVAATGEDPENADALLLTVINRGLARHLFEDGEQCPRIDHLMRAAQKALARNGAKRLEESLDFDVPALVLALGYGYDFCFDDLPADRRADVAADLTRWGDRFLAAMRGNGHWATDFGNHKLVLLHALAVVGGALVPDAAGERLLLECEREFREAIAPALDVAGGQDGGWAEGITYNRKTALSVIGMAEAVSHASGRDLWNTSPWLARNGDYIAYHLLPGGRFLAIGDVTSDVPTAMDRLILGRLAEVFHNDRYGTLAVDLPAVNGYRDDALLAGLDLAYVNPDPPSALPDPPPVSKRFEGIGLAILRESWQDDGTVVSFRSGDSISAHQHADQNSFTVFREAPLAVDSGVYDDYWSSHSFNYYRRSIAHNTIVVFDPDETFPSPRRLARDGSRGLSNDGGQNRFGAVAKTLAEYRDHLELLDAGDLEAFVSTPSYDYVRGNATKAYSRTKIERFVREIVFLRREEPGKCALLLILDDVVLARPGLRTAWLLHTVNRPEVTSQRATVRLDGAEMAVVTLMPEVAIDVVGGKGHEFEVDGRNYPPERTRSLAPPAGAWRLEFVPRRAGRDAAMITALVVGPGAAKEADRVRLDTVDGVRIVSRQFDDRIEYIVVGHPGEYVVALPVPASFNPDRAVEIENLARGERAEGAAARSKGASAQVLLIGRGPHRIVLRSGHEDS